MTCIENIVLELEKNSYDCYIEITEIITIIVKKILLHKTNLSFRKLYHNDNVFSRLLLGNGAEQCLLQMGFKKIDNYYILPPNQPLDKLIEVYLQIYERRKIVLSLKKNIFKFYNPFIKQIEKRFDNALQYENIIFLCKAKDLIPVDDLKLKSEKKLQLVQTEINNDQTNSQENLNYLFLFEFLKWFKEDFFKWVNCPPCHFCEGETKLTDVSLINNIRTEIFTCTQCELNTHFPRHENVAKLLETRKGRCGEWSKVFTLMCCALEYDARLVCDETDHVWTEIYSTTENKWLHIDPCETAFNTPLMYEVGWKKKLTYVIAYSPFEVQDVTWRYSVNHSETRKLRNKCSEKELVNALIFLREERQIGMTNTRKKYLTKRILFELVELMQEKKVSDSDSVERQSGSLLWRISRGEASKETCNPHYIWKPLSDSTNLYIRYSAAKDLFEQLDSNGKVVTQRQNWKESCYEMSSLFRKEEIDWDMVYIARQEGSNTGSISWKFSCIEDMIVDTINLFFPCEVYENGIVEVSLHSENVEPVKVMTNTSFSTNKFLGSKDITLLASISGGKGETAWQHAQLIRQSRKSSEFPFVIKIFYKKTTV